MPYIDDVTVRYIDDVTVPYIDDVTASQINEKGVSPPATLEKVTEQWEEMYQGTATKEGLWAVETLLVRGMKHTHIYIFIYLRRFCFGWVNSRTVMECPPVRKYGMSHTDES